MATFFLVIHIIVSFLLIFIVLVQGGKGADMGAAFGGGSSQTVFGGRGAATFLNKMTTGVAVVFMLTSLLLAISAVKGKSVVRQSAPPPVSAPAPAGQSAGVPEGGSLTPPPAK